MTTKGRPSLDHKSLASKPVKSRQELDSAVSQIDFGPLKPDFPMSLLTSGVMGKKKHDSFPSHEENFVKETAYKLEKKKTSGLDKEDHRLGHRARLRERFMKAGAAGIADYEMLELALFAAFPRGDVKPIAKALLKKFKTLTGIIHASPLELQKIEGVGPAAVTSLKVVGAFGELLLKEAIERGPINENFEQVINYCRLTMENLKEEQLRLLFLDQKYQLICDEVQQQGTINHTPVYTREVIKRALELGASGIIIIHNHPTGDPTPSRADIQVTQDIIDAGKRLGVAVHDHIIIGKNTQFSMRTQGMLGNS